MALLFLGLLGCVQAATLFSDGTSLVVSWPVAWECGWNNYLAYNASPPTQAPVLAIAPINTKAISIRLNSSGAYALCTRPCGGATAVNVSDTTFTAISVWINGGATGGQALQAWLTNSDRIQFNAVANSWIQLVMDFNSMQTNTVDNWAVQMIQGWSGPQPQPEMFFDNIVLETTPYRCDFQVLAYGGGNSMLFPGVFTFSSNTSVASPPTPAPGSLGDNVIQQKQGTLKIMYPTPFPTAQAGYFITGLRFWVHGGPVGGPVGVISSRFLNAAGAAVGWTQQSTVKLGAWREVRLTFSVLKLPAQVSGVQLVITSTNGLFLDEFAWTTSLAQPRCMNGLVYVPDFGCPSFSTAGVPASLLSLGLGRCPASYNDTHWCRAGSSSWSGNVLANSQAQFQLTSGWSVLQGTFTNNGMGQGFTAAGTQNTPARRKQRIDLLAFGFDSTFLNGGPPVQVLAWLRPTPTNITGALDVYRYQISLLDGLNGQLGGNSGSVNVIGPTLVNFTLPSLGVGGGLRFIEFEDQGFDDLNGGGPTIESVAVLLNLDECAVNNGGCDPHRTCVDQLSPPATCGSCFPGYLEGPMGSCILINQCAVGNTLCPPSSQCNLDAFGNVTCICLPGFYRSGALCNDTNECVVGNDTNGGCGATARCQNFVGASTSTPLCLAFPANCSLSLNAGTPTCTPFNIANNLGGQTLSVSFVGSPTVTNMRFGPPNDPDRFPCSNFSTTGNNVTCVLPKGAVGTDNAFTITLCTASTNCGPSNICCFDISSRNAGTFHLPLPTVLPSTLRFHPQGLGTNSLQSNTSFGDVVAFSGNNFLVGDMLSNVSTYTITMRSSNNSQVFTCVPQPSSTVNTTICQTPPGFGLEFFFQITLDSKVLVNTSDTYSYPTSPIITLVRGCPLNVSTGTGNCPTAGGTLVTITGGYFGPAVVVSVGGLNCAVITVTGSTSIVCSLPALTGVATVTVALGSLYSIPAPLVTYAPPTIDSVWGCPRQSGSLSALDCARNGTSVLTLQGSNFGAAPPLILVGQTPCTPVTVLTADSVVSCSIPMGMNTDVGVLFVQAGGFQAAPPFPSLSYYQCPAGFASANITCMACDAGTFTQSAGQPDCVMCPGGFYSPSSASRCSACDPGTYAQAGWANCQNCTTGMYSPAYGQSACAMCAPGSFSNLTRQSTCRPCPVGESQFQFGQADCTVCGLGTYANFFGYTSCARCPSGKYTEVMGTVDCKNCPPGTSQPQEASTGCLPCTAGSYAPSQASQACSTCDAGSYSLANSTTCSLCSAGFFQSNIGQSACSPCSAGTESRNSGRSVCDSCLVGRFAAPSTNGTVACAFCAGGSYQPNLGQSICLLCSPGRVNDKEFKSCTQCEVGRYTASPGSSLCHTCSPGSFPDALSIGCVCPVATFARLISDGVIACEDCPLGAVCDRPGIVFEALETKAAFWRPNVESVTYYRCKVPDLCLGGFNSSCDGYRTGPLCGVCLEGYAAGGPDKFCGKCPEQNLAWSYTILIFLALLLIMVICLYLVLRFLNLQQRKLIQYTRAMDEANAEKMKNTLDAFGPNDEYFAQMRKNLYEAEQEPSSDTGKSEGEEEEEEDHDDTVKKGPIRGGTKSSIKSLLVFFDSLAASKAMALTKHTQQRAPNFIYKCKILLGFFQVASIMPLNGVVSWPKYWSQFISVFSFFNFDFVPWETLGCAASISYLQKAIIVGCIPIAAVLVIAVVVYFSMLCSREAGLEIQMARQQSQERAWTQFVKLVLFTVFLLYPFTSKMTLGVYNCVSVEGVSYLAADFAVRCSGSEYWVYAGSNVVFVLVYPIGIPVVYFLLIRSIKGRLRDPHTILLYGFLYDAYQPECWYWEILDMLHKLLLTSALLFLPVNLILGACMLTVTAYLMGLLLMHPYIRKGDDRFHLLVQCNLYFLALVGLILSTVPDPYASTAYSPESLQTLLSLLLIAINIGLFIGFFIIAGRNLWKIYKNARGETKRVPVPEETPEDLQEHLTPPAPVVSTPSTSSRSLSPPPLNPAPPPPPTPGPPPSTPGPPPPTHTPPPPSSAPLPTTEESPPPPPARAAVH